MSDATGFGTGGTTDVLVAGASVGGVCDTRDPGEHISYSLNALPHPTRYRFSISVKSGATTMQARILNL